MYILLSDGKRHHEHVRDMQSTRYGVNYRNMARAQDEIGWRRFLEGMISSEFRRLQHKYYVLHGLRTSVKQWSTDLITKLLEVTHGQWLCRNIQVHDKVA